MMQGLTLADLIEATRYQGGKLLSYESLSKNCGGKPPAQQLQQYVTSGLKNCPGPDVIHGLQRGTGQSVQPLFHAAARSLGLIATGSDPDALVAASVSKLPPSSMDTLRMIARELVTLSSVAHHEDQDKPQKIPSGPRTLRAVGSGHEAVTAQKVPRADYSDFETRLPIEQLAAHPDFKAELENLAEANVARGEEDQDPEEQY